MEALIRASRRASPMIIRFVESFMRDMSQRWSEQPENLGQQSIISLFIPNVPAVLPLAVEAYLQLEEDRIVKYVEVLLLVLMNYSHLKRQHNFLYYCAKRRDTLKLRTRYNHDKFIQFVAEITFVAMCLKKLLDVDYTHIATLTIVELMSYVFSTDQFVNEGGYATLVDVCNVKILNFRNKFENRSLDDFYWQAFIDRVLEINCNN